MQKKDQNKHTSLFFSTSMMLFILPVLAQLVKGYVRKKQYSQITVEKKQDGTVYFVCVKYRQSTICKIYISDNGSVPIKSSNSNEKLDVMYDLIIFFKVPLKPKFVTKLVLFFHPNNPIFKEKREKISAYKSEVLSRECMLFCSIPKYIEKRLQQAGINYYTPLFNKIMLVIKEIILSYQVSHISDPLYQLMDKRLNYNLLDIFETIVNGFFRELLRDNFSIPPLMPSDIISITERYFSTADPNIIPYEKIHFKPFNDFENPVAEEETACCRLF